MCETMVLTLVLAVGGIAILFCLPLNQQLFACGAMIIVCTVVFVCLLEMMLLRKMLVKHAEKLLDTLDDMIAEKEEISFSEYHDTLTVKIQDRMKQYHEIMIYTREENQKEKEMIQSMVSDIAHQVSKFKDVCRNSWAEKPFRGEKETVFYDDGGTDRENQFLDGCDDEDVQTGDRACLLASEASVVA